jgi:hypothetical protein
MSNEVEHSELIADIAEVMAKHKVSDLLLCYIADEKFKNAYLTANEEPHEFLTSLSDSIDTWVKLKVKEYE